MCLGFSQVFRLSAWRLEVVITNYSDNPIKSYQVPYHGTNWVISKNYNQVIPRPQILNPKPLNPKP